MISKQIAKALKDAHDYILFDRDCFYESITTSDGSIPDERDRKDLAAVDGLLDEIKAAMESLK